MYCCDWDMCDSDAVYGTVSGGSPVSSVKASGG